MSETIAFVRWPCTTHFLDYSHQLHRTQSWNWHFWLKNDGECEDFFWNSELLLSRARKSANIKTRDFSPLIEIILAGVYWIHLDVLYLLTYAENVSNKNGASPIYFLVFWETSVRFDTCPKNSQKSFISLLTIETSHEPYKHPHLKG